MRRLSIFHEVERRRGARALLFIAAILACVAALALGPRAPRVAAQNTPPGRILTSSGAGFGGIIEFNTNGTNGVNLTANTFEGGACAPATRHKETHPSVSRDGRLVAFQSTRDPNSNQGAGPHSRIFVMNSDGTNVRQLTFNVPAGSFRPIK